MSSQLQIPCLGRPFNLGMLYNCHSEQLIPGATLWNVEKLESTKLIKEQPSSSYKIVTDDSLQSKLSSLGITTDMKLSVISGLVKVEGAAKYLLDELSSESQCRVSLHYLSTTHFEQLAMDQLGDVEFPCVLDEQDATHMVTGITYGADAFFVFDRHIGKNERLEDVRGNMEAAIKAVVSKGTSWDASGKAETENFNCKFYGDLILCSNPATFEEAVELIRQSSDASNVAKPKTVYLSPIGRKPQQVVRSISLNLVYQVEEIMEYFHHTEMHANDLMKCRMCIKFSDVRSQLSKFKKLLACFKANFIEKLSQLLPQIRRSEEQEKKLAELVSWVNCSPFSSSETKKFLQNKDKEIKLLAQYLTDLEMNRMLYFDFPDTDLDVIAFSNWDSINHVACFAFNVTSETCAYLENLDSYIQTRETKPADDHEWFDKPEGIEQLRSEITKFLSFAKNTSYARKTAFAVTSSVRNIGKPGPSIIIFTAGVPALFDQPGTPQATKTTIDSVTLSWTPPKHSDVSSYKILYRSKGEPEFKSIDSMGKVTTRFIKDLSHGVEYEFKVQATSTSKFPLESDTALIKTTEYYDVVLVGKTGQGKSSLGNKLLDLENTDESQIQLFDSAAPATTTMSTAMAPSAPSTVTTSSTTSSSTPTTAMTSSTMVTSASVKTPSRSRKRFFQADDPEVNESGEEMLSITAECKLLSNEDTKIRVLDVPGFSDSGTLQRALGKNISVYNGNLQIIRWVVREQFHSHLKVRRIVYFLPMRGPLEKADGTMQEELKILYHFFGQEVFNCMVVVATNPPKKKFQELGFDEEDYTETRRVFHLALKTAIDIDSIDCPPIIYIGMNDNPEETLSKIKNAEVLKGAIVPLNFKDDTCALCSVKIHSNENNERVSIVDTAGKVIPYAESRCHPSFVPKYTAAQKLLGGIAHIATLGIGLVLEKMGEMDSSWPGFTNSDEICVSCKQSPGAKGCTLVGKEVVFTPHNGDKKKVTVKTDHSNEL